MSDKSLTPRPVGEAYLDFLFTARKVAREMDMFDVRKANRISKRLSAIARELKSSEDGKNELRRLMQFSDPVVRMEAAASCLDFDEESALAVLREVKTSDSEHARSMASFHIAYWRVEHGLPMFEEFHAPASKSP
jgi:hypothetical protein